jgi:methylthioribulose-1-phosphate dehydratase
MLEQNRMTTNDPLETRRIACAAQIAEAGRELSARGWTPATSSNFSVRADATHAAITVSGRDKGRLTADDVMLVDLEGRAVGTPHKPSAETLLHTQLYARDPRVGAVLHTHSRNQTIASRLYAPAREIRLEGYELLKAFAGFDTHERVLVVPVFANSQDMVELSQRVARWLESTPAAYGYLIDGHGIYAWGRDMAEAKRHLEAFEFLLDCELELKRLRTQ